MSLKEQSEGLQETSMKEAGKQGIDLFGVADLSDTKGFVCAQGGDYLGIFPRAISIGIRLLNAVVGELHRHEDRTVIFTYRGHYNAINARLDQAALTISKRIQQKGFNAYPIPASQMINSERLTGAISHKLVAHLAGLGWIGKSCLLITPEYGPRVRFATIMTDAPIKTATPIADRCGGCQKCVDICPVKAFTGVKFDPAEPRETRFKAILCREYSDRRRETLGEGLCGLCVYICPYGMQKEATTRGLSGGPP